MNENNTSTSQLSLAKYISRTVFLSAENT